ncbi:hypothetical protein MKZ38_010417 [Zalerion maritima]|uniref:Uncharacterized protein n=1 Tax=Zalerion maritima TaxID=339359 RepID=A0AAD5RGC7_9PEZI|nr:hypothetical protein MKZ38_010417 [Zalerion maritima]
MQFTLDERRPSLLRPLSLLQQKKKIQIAVWSNMKPVVVGIEALVEENENFVDIAKSGRFLERNKEEMREKCGRG